MSSSPSILQLKLCGFRHLIGHIPLHISSGADFRNFKMIIFWCSLSYKNWSHCELYIFFLYSFQLIRKFKNRLQKSETLGHELSNAANCNVLASAVREKILYIYIYKSSGQKKKKILGVIGKKCYEQKCLRIIFYICIQKFQNRRCDNEKIYENIYGPQ